MTALQHCAVLHDTYMTKLFTATTIRSALLLKCRYYLITFGVDISALRQQDGSSVCVTFVHCSMQGGVALHQAGCRMYDTSHLSQSVSVGQVDSHKQGTGRAQTIYLPSKNSAFPVPLSAYTPSSLRLDQVLSGIMASFSQSAADAFARTTYEDRASQAPT